MHPNPIARIFLIALIVTTPATAAEPAETANIETFQLILAGGTCSALQTICSSYQVELFASCDTTCIVDFRIVSANLQSSLSHARLDWTASLFPMLSGPIGTCAAQLTETQSFRPFRCSDTDYISGLSIGRGEMVCPGIQTKAVNMLETVEDGGRQCVALP